MTDCILHFPYDCYLQDIFNYASPLLIGMETILNDGITEPFALWVQTLETTRHLLAHCTQSVSYMEEWRTVVAQNMRNLYRLYGMDLSEKTYWQNVTGDTVTYMPRRNDKKKTIWIDKNPKIAREKYLIISFEELKCDFDNDDKNNDAKEAFGRALYILVATSDGKWKGEVNQAVKAIGNLIT